MGEKYLLGNGRMENTFMGHTILEMVINILVFSRMA